MSAEPMMPDVRVLVDLTETGDDGHPTGLPDLKAATALATTHLRELGELGLDEDALATATARMTGMLAIVAAAEQRVASTMDKLDHAEELATTDPLTGLANHRRWWEALEIEAARCARSGGYFAVAVIDLDGLKKVNDERGHLEGDLLLRVAGSTIRTTVRTVDEVARVGGDEFAVLAVDHEHDGVDHLITRLYDALDEAGIDASVGAAVSNGTEPFTLTYQRADEAMYAAKRVRRLRRSR
jgi:diguanylate cyclase (GGDEF)-like protein